ncbi:MAG: putative peptidoglycan glycosyltransferase FtsW [Ignavibacteriaceae bacterium]
MKKLAITVFFESFTLLLLGLVLVMSASSTYSIVKFDSAFHLFNLHLVKVIAGTVLILAFSFIPYTVYRSYAKLLLFAGIGLLIITLIFAPVINGAHRWLIIGPMTFQTADFARLALIIYLAAFLEKKDESIKIFYPNYLIALLAVLIIAFFIFLQPNISNGVLISIIGITMLYAGGAKIKHILLSVISCVFAGGIMILIYPHALERILDYIKVIASGGFLNSQVMQAIYGLGSGGLLGVGLGNSQQNNLFLPEAYGDFIFAILGEETGLVGSLVVLFLYFTLFFTGILIAKRTADKFGQMVAFGISFTIGIYAFINIAVTAGLLPTTGLPLPFVSYGGSSLFFLSVSVGILINIALSNGVLKSYKEKLSDITDSRLKVNE